MRKLLKLIINAVFCRFSWRHFVHFLNLNWKGVTAFPAGHFYSPLIDIKSLTSHKSEYSERTARYWDCIELNKENQIKLHSEFLELCRNANLPSFRRYQASNVYFYFADAFVASGMMLKFRPKRIVEIGSGFSSAAMLDADESMNLCVTFDFIDPFPERLIGLLSSADKGRNCIHHCPVQQVPTELFSSLQSGDFLFVDSSHVLKVDSDLEDIFLRIIPVLKPGVIIHFHDVFFPCPYPLDWVELGRAWNEAIIIQLLLRLSPLFEVIFFNSYFAVVHADQLALQNPRFLQGIPASIWLRRV